ncbi:4-hydroxy-2-oxovalerate aldolase [Arcobacter aquimarinus]|uniref:4-hydroxy-2-oxovalerate aldolase n=1 Tax=Arcobacter aquimarinus TaxID=1315211 RepID=A0AAE7B1Q4_9BACT|nr:4-hydroxy-2-oxovalerate aldolase [Arcobacter aquimarinus]QKE25739.1 4-hydroxy-2-oxovalerate aldolase [Arcobacter aquimarinus]RXI35970.1 4-hydroxy-2-oxovalerate aldolase [Arcobacter aquimarinus]
MDLRGKKIKIHDMSLRDGMHSIRHQFSLEEMTRMSTAMDSAGVPYIEVTHGDGLGGSSLNYGFGKHTDEEWLDAVVPYMKNAKISALMLPGIGIVKDLESAVKHGISMVRVATHCTEADCSAQHIKAAVSMGIDTVGFLMMAHMVTPEKLLQEAAKMVSYGAKTIYATDSAGYMLPDDVSARIAILKKEFGNDIEIGFHGHNNLSMGVANSLAAIEAGATRIDASLAGFGAGSGNTATEVLVAVCNRMGVDTGIDLEAIEDAAEDIALPIMGKPTRISRDSITLGYAGVYSSFLLFARRAEEKYGIDARTLLVELGKRGMIGGQEDMIDDCAMELARAKGLIK